LHPGHALAALMYANRDGDQPLDRLSRYEHRLEQTFHRCLRDLHVLKQKARQYADEPPSPFRTQYGVAGDEKSDDDARAAADKNAAPPTLGETESNAQNEPTAPASSASTGPADSSDAPATPATPATPPPDPAEMAALAQFADQLSRRRPREEDQDDPEYDVT
jgi:hypothetical protein